MKTVVVEYDRDGLWRFVIYERGAVVSKSAYKYESDLEARYAGKKKI